MSWSTGASRSKASRQRSPATLGSGRRTLAEASEFNGRNRNRANGRPRRREYDKSSRTRAAILAAAMDEFSRHGFGGARIDRIARAAHLNNHALYYHFGNKEELFKAALEYGYESLRANL